MDIPRAGGIVSGSRSEQAAFHTVNPTTAIILTAGVLIWRICCLPACEGQTVPVSLQGSNMLPLAVAALHSLIHCVHLHTYRRWVDYSGEVGVQ
jgi:hypothetical protein